MKNTIHAEFAAAQRAADKRAAEAKTIDQATLASHIFHALQSHFTMDEIQKVLDAERTAVTQFLAKGHRVVMHNYMILYTSKTEPRKLTCPLDGKPYDIPETVRVNVRIGEGLKRAVQAQTAKPGATRKAAASTGATLGDKKRPEAQRPGAGQAGGKAGAKRGNPDTLAATAEGATT